MPRRTKLRSTAQSARGPAAGSSGKRNESFDEMEVYGSGSDLTSAASSYTSMASMEISGLRKYDDYKPEVYRDEEDDDDGEEIYVVRQNNGYFAVLFSLVQTVILGIMMWQCGVAPMKSK